MFTFDDVIMNPDKEVPLYTDKIISLWTYGKKLANNYRIYLCEVQRAIV